MPNLNPPTSASTHAPAPTPRRAGGWAHALGLLLLIPAPTIGVVVAMYLAPDTWYGQATHALTKVWILALPLLWLIGVGKLRPRPPLLRSFRGLRSKGRGLFDGLFRPPFKGLLAGLVTGVLTLGVIVGVWELAAKHWVDHAFFAEQICKVGLRTPLIYLAFAATLTVVNALLEEYVWRWFVYERFRDTLLVWLAPRKEGASKWIVPGAVVLAALAFTLHHTVAMSLYFDPRTNALASLGVFLGSVIWSTIYLKTGNIYGGYISHIFADIALFYVGYQIAFG